MISRKIIILVTIVSLLIIFMTLSILYSIHFATTENNFEVTYYELDFKQNKTDFSYQINVLGRDGDRLKTDSIKLELNGLVGYESTKAFFVSDYQTQKEFFEHMFLEVDLSGAKYLEINLSITISFFDVDNNDYLSQGDYFILKIKNMDKNEDFNFSQYKYEQLVLKLTNKGNSCAHCFINDG